MKHAKYKLSLKKKITLGVVCLTISLVAAATISGYFAYASKTDAHYKRTAYNVARTAAAQLDADKLAPFLKTLEKDEEYYEAFDKLLEIKSNNDVLWLYIVSFTEHGDYFILDADVKSPMEPGEAYIADKALLPHMEELRKGSPVSFVSNNEFGWFVTSFAPLLDSDGNAVAMVGADIPMNEVMSDRLKFLLILCVCMFATAAVHILIFLYLTGKVITGPLSLLTEVAGSFVSRRENADAGISDISALNIRTGDEIEKLSETFKTMEQDVITYIARLTRVTAEKERISAELNVAREIQASLLPRVFPPFPERREFEIFASMLPAKEVGGDFYDFFFIDENKLAIVIGDVSGKGVPAALFMVIAKTLIKNNACQGFSPKEVFETVNDTLCESNDTGMFVTAFMGYFDMRDGSFVYVNAGHNPPLIRKADGDYEYLVPKSALMLAVFEGTVYTNEETSLNCGETLFLYTDGVTEAADIGHAMFTDERLHTAINKYKSSSVKELLASVKHEIDGFVCGAEQADDITMLALKSNI